MVLANVPPSFRFSFRGNIRRNHPFGNHPFANPRTAHWKIKGRFRKRVVLANVPSFRFSFRGNIRRNHPFGNHPFANPRTLRFKKSSETGRIRFRRARFQTPSSVSFLGLTEFRGANSVSSSWPFICVPK